MSGDFSFALVSSLVQGVLVVSELCCVLDDDDAVSGCGCLELCVLDSWAVVVIMAIGFDLRRSSVGGVTGGSVIT